MKKPAFRAAIIACVLLPALAAVPQDYRARVQGLVTDETRAVLPGVTVTLRNDATGISNTFVTNEVGRYWFRLRRAR